MRFNIFPLVILITVTRYTGAYQDKYFIEGLAALLKEGVTLNQIRQWWFNSQAKQRKFPRVFPFCFALDRPFPPKVAPYKPYIQKLNKIHEYDPKEFGWSSRGFKMSKFKDMAFFRISIQRRQPNPNIYHGEEGKNPFKLQQWVNFLVTFTQPIEGLYVQAYGGPLGVPIGEFTTDIKCTHGEKDDQEYEQNQNVFPCHFAPRTAFMHSNVFIFDARNRGKKDKVQFRFRWTETQCQETGFFQFIMVATSDHSSDFDAILSPIFKCKDLDTESAVPSPYHPYYDMVTCGISPKDPYTKHISNITDGKRIIPNPDYDDCILNQVGRGTGFTRDSCPPGPFKCQDIAGENVWDSGPVWNNRILAWWNTIVLASSDRCCEVRFPLDASSITSTRTTTSATMPLTPEQTLQEKQEKFLKDVTIRSEKKLQITHGDFCVLVWLVLMPIANLVSRFFKDFPEVESVGLGFWIIAHVFLQTIGLMIVWWSFGLVVGGGKDKLGNISGRHFLLGIVSTTIQHLQFITGLKREAKECKTFTYVLIHSYGGYFAQVIAWNLELSKVHFLGCIDLAVILSNAAPERKWISFAFTFTGVISAVAFHLVERKQDKILGVYSVDTVLSRTYKVVEDVDDVFNETAANERTVVFNNQAYFVDIE